MAWETTLLRKTSLRRHPHCLDTLDAYSDIVPIWQRICLFLYTALGTWLATQFGIDMTAMWTMGELVIQDIMAVTKLESKEIAEKLHQFVAIKLRHSAPLDFEDAKEAVYDQMFWPMAAHMAFAVQPSATVRLNFAKQIADSIATEEACVADLGCGPGVILCSILARKPSWMGQGLDISQAAIEYASRLAGHKALANRARFSTGDIANLPYADASFDLVVASEVLEHVPEIEKALSEIARVLRPGGKAVITVPLESRTALHIHSLTAQEHIERLCRRAGLTVRSLETRQYLGFGDDWRHVFLVADAPACQDRLARPGARILDTTLAASESLSEPCRRICF